MACQCWLQRSFCSDEAEIAEAVLLEEEWVDHIMGKATLNCTCNGLLCAMFCMAAYTMATEENCKVLGNVSAAPFKTHRVVLWILKASLILFVLSGFITFCASVFYFQYLCLRAIHSHRFISPTTNSKA